MAIVSQEASARWQNAAIPVALEAAQMIELGASSEAEMIAAFLRAEARSAARFGPALEFARRLIGAPSEVVDNPDTGDEAENAARLEIFRRYRGYPEHLLFRGFPAVTWHRVQLEPGDFQRMRYAKEETTLVPLSGPSRLVTEGARNFQAGVPAAAPMIHIAAIVEAVKRGERFPELIAAQDTDGSLVLIEGHSRATGYVIAGRTDGIEAIVARAGSFAGWAFY